MPDPQKALTCLKENKGIYLRPLGASAWDKSRVEACLRDYLCAAHPLSQGRLKKVSVDDRMEIGFAVEKDFYTFLSVVLKTTHKPVPQLVLTLPTPNELINVQRRLSPRVDTLIPLAYQVLAGPVSDASHHTLTLNLSASGLSFNAPHPISAGQGLLLDFQIPNSTLGISAKGEVVSCQKVVTSHLERYKIRVKFLAVSRGNQARIESYVKNRTESQERLQ